MPTVKPVYSAYYPPNSVARTNVEARVGSSQLQIQATECGYMVSNVDTNSVIGVKNTRANVLALQALTLGLFGSGPCLTFVVLLADGGIDEITIRFLQQDKA